MVETIHTEDFSLDFDYDNYEWYVRMLDAELDKVNDYESFNKCINKYIDDLENMTRELWFDDNEDNLFSDDEVLKDIDS